MSFKSLVTSKYQVNAKQLGFMEYVEELDNGYHFDAIFEDMRRSGSGFDERKLIEFVKHSAQSDHITLDDNIDEDALFEMYKVRK